MPTFTSTPFRQLQRGSGFGRAVKSAGKAKKPPFGVKAATKKPVSLTPTSSALKKPASSAKKPSTTTTTTAAKKKPTLSTLSNKSKASTAKPKAKTTTAKKPVTPAAKKTLTNSSKSRGTTAKKPATNSSRNRSSANSAIRELAADVALNSYNNVMQGSSVSPSSLSRTLQSSGNRVYNNTSSNNRSSYFSRPASRSRSRFDSLRNQRMAGVRSYLARDYRPFDRRRKVQKRYTRYQQFGTGKKKGGKGRRKKVRFAKKTKKRGFKGMNIKKAVAAKRRGKKKSNLFDLRRVR